MSKDRFSAIPTRLAMESEELIIHTFPDGSTGFVGSGARKNYESSRLRAIGKLACILKKAFRALESAESVSAIYVPFGTHLILKNIPAEIQQKHGVQSQEGVIFTPINMFSEAARDGLEFPKGSHICLRDLPEGTPLEVLSLASMDLVGCERDFATHTEV
jgi:hypothetical protein